MRVLVVSADYPPLSRGGYELQCQGCVEELRRRGHEVRVLSAFAPAGPADIDVHRVLPRFPAREATPAEQDAAAPAEERSRALLAEHLADFRPDVVSLWRLGELSMSLASGLPCPAVAMVCDPWPAEGPKRDPWAARHGADLAGSGVRWLFVSAALRDQLGMNGEVVPWGADVDRLVPGPERPWRGRLLSAGRLSALKGVQDAVAAADRLPDCVLDVAGTGPLRLEPRPNVRLLGLLDPDDLAAAYRDADVFLFLPRWPEPFGGAAIEAMACGTPVIATGTGGSASFLVDGETALLVPPAEPDAVAAAVRRLAADPALRDRLRRAGRAAAERLPAARSHDRVIEALGEAA